MIRLPDWAYNRLARAFYAQREIRMAQDKRRITERDHALRAWADQAAIAHDAGRCVPRCPFAHVKGLRYMSGGPAV